MKVAIVSGSPRAGSQSARISELINSRFFAGSAEIIDLHQTPLPEWNGTGFGDPAVKAVRQQLAQADALVIVAPEWNGMAPAALKNLFLWCSYKQLAHKPALLVAISAGDGGAFVVTELRSSSYKNSRLLYLPEHVILRDVEALWVDGETSTEELQRRESYLHKRLAYGVELLQAYGESMVSVRERMEPHFEEHTNGMS
ncbi:NAD(P)H-dependent oxidoreductase [Maricurvus nonylphenolicus]|uniref:NADPH-dependent FMN reductase n=1 Tax=Maricurvus nonylphenolicus TaxID=1008307 RepID=UPI0036F2AF4C